MDLMYTREGGLSRLEVIGAMTQYVDAGASAGTEIFAIRFRPGGMGLGLGADELRDAAVEWQAIHPHDARLLKTRLDDARTVQERIAICGAILPAPQADAVQNAIAELESRRGMADLDWLASQAGVSERQFRRRCVARTGLAPKQLARILRFRHILSRLRGAKRGDLTALALDCGFYDQAHFIHEFRQFTGESPVRFLQSSSAAEPLHSVHESLSHTHDGAD
ncbi:MAG: AraC family transcriptional regulator [Acidobacteria bacterium]|nr:AraC family transcriptional regulator [Acidobacteriota bacterium]